MYVICDLAMHIILSKSNNYDVRDFSLDARIPSMYYQAQPESYQNVQNYIPDVYLPYNSTTSNATKKTGIVVPVSVTQFILICITPFPVSITNSYFNSSPKTKSQTTRKVLRSDDETATTSAASNTSPTSPALTIQAANQTANVNTTNSSSNDTEDEQTNGKEATPKTRSKQSNQTDENTEPPAKRLRTRAATAALNHQ